MQDATYLHERDKHEVRLKHHGGRGWKSEKEGDLLKRDYAGYEEYVTHQKQKLDEMLKMKGGFSNWDICEYRLRIQERCSTARKLGCVALQRSSQNDGRELFLMFCLYELRIFL